MSDGLANHEITVALKGGAVLSPFQATRSTEIVSDARELAKDYDAYYRKAKRKSASSIICMIRVTRTSPFLTR